MSRLTTQGIVQGLMNRWVAPNSKGLQRCQQPVWRKSIPLLGATLASYALVSSLGAGLPQRLQDCRAGSGCGVALFQGDRAEAKRSGGRSRSGSFSRPSRSTGGSSGSGSSGSGSSGSGSSGSYSSPSRSEPYRETREYHHYYNSGPRVYTSTYSSGYGSTSGFWTFLIVLLIMVGLIGVAIWAVRATRASGTAGSAATGNRELDNDVVTVTQLQVALLAQARTLQQDLERITADVDTDSPEGVHQLLQESVLALLRHPEYWTHVRVSSQVCRDRATPQGAFETFSLAERAKVGEETLVNVGGRVQRRVMQDDEPESGADAIVVTLALGTEHDKSILGPIHTTEELREALQRLATLPADYLSVVEVLWTPQAEGDTLSAEELLLHYPDMVQIA